MDRSHDRRHRANSGEVLQRHGDEYEDDERRALKKRDELKAAYLLQLERDGC